MSGDVAAQAGVGTAHLSSSVDDEDGPYTIHGIAIGEGDVTYGKSQTKKKWTADALKEVAETLEGQPLVKNHQNDSEGTIGEVKRTSYQDGVGVRYEAEIADHYDEFAKDVASGILDVSPRILHTPPAELEEDAESGALLVEGRAFGDNLSLVSDGASPSNTAEFGPADSFASTQDGVVATLERASSVPSADEIRDEFDEHVDVGLDELSFTSMKFYGPAFDEFVDDSEVQRVVDDLNQHDAVTATASAGNHSDIGVMVDTEVVSNVDELNQHFIDALEETPYEKHEDWSWLDRAIDEHLAHGDELEHPYGDGERPEWESGDMVRWQVEPDLFGKIVHVDEEKYVVMVEVMERSDGDLSSTGFTVTAGFSDIKPMKEDGMEMDGDDSDSEMSSSDEAMLDEEELAEMSTHTPDFSGGADQEWNSPDLEDFADTAWEDLSDDEQSSIADHFIVSKSGFPPETFGDLALPVVEPDGTLNLNALSNAKARAGQVSGLSGDTLDSVESMIDRLANENFEDASFGSEDDEMAQHDEETLAVASLEGDDGRYVTSGQSTSGKKHAAFGTIDTTMTDINYEELSQADLDEDEYVAVREEELHDLGEQAEAADELDDRLDDVNSTLDELADAQDLLDDADEDQVEELAALDEPVVRSQDEWDELQSLVSSVGDVYAEELADYSPFSTEELTDKFTPMELRDKVEEHDDAELASGDPEPDGGYVEEEELEEGDDDEPTSVDELSEEEKRDIIADELAADGLARQAEKVRNGDLSIDGFEIVSEA
jgi:hypothetical protein